MGESTKGDGVVKRWLGRERRQGDRVTAETLAALPESKLSPEQRKFRDEWLTAQTVATARSIGAYGIAAGTVALLGIALLDVPARDFLVKGHSLVLITTIIWYVCRLRNVAFSSAMLLVPQVLLVAMYAELTRAGFAGEGPSAILAAASTLAFAIIFARLTPELNGWFVLVQAALFFAIGFWPFIGQPEFARWATIFGLSVSFASICEYSKVKRARGEALLEFDTRARIRATERRAMEREMELARQIQDSYLPPPTQLVGERVRVHTFQRKYHALGGDWVALRHLADGRVVILVADASGKGVQAALVTHALQSLWASALADEKFDPVAWLNHVNATLKILGRATLQTMTIGLAVISDMEIVYFSAGHIPCFVAVAGESGGRYVKTLRASGNMVGVVDELDLVPARLDLTKYSRFNVLLGSDGVFHNAQRTRPPHILSVIDKLEGADIDGLMSEDTGDDKLLVWVQRQAA